MLLCAGLFLGHSFGSGVLILRCRYQVQVILPILPMNLQRASSCSPTGRGRTKKKKGKEKKKKTEIKSSPTTDSPSCESKLAGYENPPKEFYSGRGRPMVGIEPAPYRVVQQRRNTSCLSPTPRPSTLGRGVVGNESVELVYQRLVASWWGGERKFRQSRVCMDTFRSCLYVIVYAQYSV